MTTTCSAPSTAYVLGRRWQELDERARGHAFAQFEHVSDLVEEVGVDGGRESAAVARRHR
jgi:hypothetical protein